MKIVLQYNDFEENWCTIEDMKSQEIELRALIKAGNLDLVLEKLNSIGAEDKGVVFIHDIYFCDKSSQKVEDAEMNKVGSFSVRIRREIKNGKEKITFNKKTITKENDHNAWEEFEEEREELEKARKEMFDLGYKYFFELEKNRHKFSYKNMEIEIEDIKDFGLGVEVEIMAEPRGEEESKKKIRKFLKEKLDIGEEDIVPKSITNIIMHERAFKKY